MERSCDGFGGGVALTGLESDLLDIKKKIIAVKADRNYWFVRTEGGQLYHVFLEEGVVAIGYPRIKIPDVTPDVKPKSLYNAMVKQVRQHYPEAKRPGLIAKQIVTFNLGMKKGDVVIIPGPNTTELSFGIIEDDVAHHATLRLGEKDIFERKARHVHWVKRVQRRRLNPNLFSMFFAHQTISNGKEYASYIDNTLNDFFIKEGKVFLQLPVEKSKDIHARALFESCLGLLNLADEFMTYAGIPETTEDVEVKVNINSPGMVEFMGYSFTAIATLGILIFAVTGANFSLKVGGAMLEFKTEGLLQKLTEFLAQKSKNNALDEMVSSMM